MSCIKNYIIDLDGTLLDSSKEVLKCFREAFSKAGYSCDESRLSSDLIGPPLRDIIINISPVIKYDELAIESIIKEFRKLYDNEVEDSSELYPGVLDWLRGLKQDNKRLFIATLKPTLPTLRILEQYGLNMFEDVYTIDKFLPVTGKNLSKAEMIADIIQKYCLEKGETVMIGDSPSDMLAAKANQIKGIGVLWGYGSDKSKLIENADCVISEV